MARGLTDPLQAHWLALSIISLYADNDFQDVLYYMIGKPLQPREIEVIEYYKANLQKETSNALKIAK